MLFLPSLCTSVGVIVAIIESFQRRSCISTLLMKVSFKIIAIFHQSPYWVFRPPFWWKMAIIDYWRFHLHESLVFPHHISDCSQFWISVYLSFCFCDVFSPLFPHHSRVKGTQDASNYSKTAASLARSPAEEIYTSKDSEREQGTEREKESAGGRILRMTEAKRTSAERHRMHRRDTRDWNTEHKVWTYSTKNTENAKS